MLPSNEKRIAVIGASGQQGGGGVLRALQAGGQFRVRALSRNPGKHRELSIDDQNIVLLFLEALGTGCSTSQCSTILPSTSKRKMSTPAISWPNKFR